MTWERCKSYGLAIPTENGDSIKLYYTQFDYELTPLSPGGVIFESAMWQGDFLQVRGRYNDGRPVTILYENFGVVHSIH